MIGELTRFVVRGSSAAQFHKASLFLLMPTPHPSRPNGRERWPHPGVRRSFAPAATGGDAERSR